MWCVLSAQTGKSSQSGPAQGSMVLVSLDNTLKLLSSGEG